MAARVMTFDEVRNIDLNEDYVWLKIVDEPDYHVLFHLKLNYIDFGVLRPDYIASFTVPFDNATFDASYYGKDWRVWTEKPSFDLQHSTRWQK